MMRWQGWAGVCLCATFMALVVMSGCPEPEPISVDPVEDPPDAPALAEERAREIVASVTRVDAEDVTIMEQASEDGVLIIDARIPAHDDMLTYDAARPGVDDDYEVEQRVEWVTVRWDLEAEHPRDVMWSERLQFAEQEPVEEAEALAVAEDLKHRWFPEVPVEMTLQSPYRLNRPVWAITWRGEVEDDVLTGDQVAVQISAVTGLPIAYSQAVAVQRPSPDEIEVPREYAIEAVREALVERGEERVADIPLVARLVLSAPPHPEGGPAWMVRSIGRRAALIASVDAMTGEVLLPPDNDDGDDG